MQLTWKQRLESEPNLNSFGAWPQIDSNLLPRSKRKVFLRNKRIIALVLSGSTLKNAAQEYGVSSSLVTQILNRSLSGEDSEPPPLTKALIPGARINFGNRKMALSDISKPCGARGSFSYLLKNIPNLKEILDTVIISSLKRERYSQNLTPKYFHKEFLRLLRDANWPITTYPFDQQHLGYESCRQYLKSRIAELTMPQPRKVREILSRKACTVPYQEIQIDSQILDVHTSMYIEFKGQMSPLRLSRLTLFLATDVATGCHLAYELCLTKDPTQVDLLNLLQNIHRKWQPLELKTPGLNYEPEACLPSALCNLNRIVSVGMIRLDNALCHMSHLVRSYICDELGATVNFGLPAQPKGRNMVEYAFKRLNEHIHRFPSTTGSNSLDPLKESKKNLIKPPVLTINSLNEILSVLITHHNVMPQEKFGGRTPIDIMKFCMDNQFIPLSYAHLEKRMDPFLRRKKVKVRWLIKDNRKPHIHFQGFRYTGNGIHNTELVNSEIVIEYDIRDIRRISAYSCLGDKLGTLSAPKSWQNYPLSLSTLRKIRGDTQRLRGLGVDPLAGYFEFLLANKDRPSQATELLRVYKEYSSSTSSLKLLSSAQLDKKISPSSIFSRNKPRYSSRIPSWSPYLINKNI